MSREYSFIDKTERPWPNDRLKQATIVGHTTPTATRIWARTAALGKFELLIYEQSSARASADKIFPRFKAVPFDSDKLGPEVRRIPFEIPDWETDSTHVVDVGGLLPATDYRYAVFRHHDEDANRRVIVGQDRPLSFRTLPENDDAFSFAFFSCHRPYKKTLLAGTQIANMGMWEALRSALLRHRTQDLRFLIAGGDQVYVDTVPSLDIWKYLNSRMARTGSKLLPTESDMVGWYRDIYRGYWGHLPVRQIFSDFPTYMIWDDHEIADGWGSHFLQARKENEVDELLPDLKERKLSRSDGRELIGRMFRAAKRVYFEYEHSHNPPTPADLWDYSFSVGSSAFYVLDGRGSRDVERDEYRILGREQFERFSSWLDGPEVAAATFVFVVSAVPVLHLKAALANAESKKLFRVLVDKFDLEDDLRDSWEHELHDAERRLLLDRLFTAADRGKRIAILSGDVHIAAAFRMTRGASLIYQLTSSAITFTQPRLLGWALAQGMPDSGSSDDGYDFERLAAYTQSNFSIIKVDQESGELIFQLYGEQSVQPPEEAAVEVTTAFTHSIAKIPLRFA